MRNCKSVNIRKIMLLTALVLFPVFTEGSTLSFDACRTRTQIGCYARKQKFQTKPISPAIGLLAVAAFTVAAQLKTSASR